MNKNSVWFKIWDVVYPFLLYYALLMFFFNMSQIILGKNPEKYMYCQIIATVIVLPLMYFNLYRFQLKDAYIGNNRKLIMALGIPGAVLISLGLNNIILMLPIASASEGFSEANADFYGGLLIAQIIGSGILTPILEEMVFRGIIFGRLRRIMRPAFAVVISALFFAMIHLNMVQFPYAFLVGIALAILVDLTKSLWTSIICHMAANLLAIFGTNFGLFDFLQGKSPAAWIVSALVLLAGIVLLVFCVIRENKSIVEA